MFRIEAGRRSSDVRHKKDTLVRLKSTATAAGEEADGQIRFARTGTTLSIADYFEYQPSSCGGDCVEVKCISSHILFTYINIHHHVIIYLCSSTRKLC